LDGTFNTAPKVYSKKGQLYTIHGLMQSSHEKGLTQDAFPFIYALLPNKCKSTYIDRFEAIKNVSQVPLNPEYGIIDFEMAVLEALKSAFPSSKIRGCWFHFWWFCSVFFMNFLSCQNYAILTFATVTVYPFGYGIKTIIIELYVMNYLLPKGLCAKLWKPTLALCKWLI
jgi:hypothetical protein